jgi:hypothetical protein
MLGEKGSACLSSPKKILPPRENPHDFLIGRALNNSAGIVLIIKFLSRSYFF